jgi:2-polyprenyl-6-methoxyphenol hydroxylase-like FAD-dependent oxidoreductase
MLAVKSVLIVGGGAAGLCAAIALTKRGVEVEVAEINELVFPDAPKPFFTGQTVWRAVVPRPEDPDHDIAMYYGPCAKAGVNPVCDTRIYVFEAENTPTITHPPRDQWPELIRGLPDDFGGVIAWARERMPDPETIYRRALHAVLVPSRWYRGRVRLIGDEAHATTPHRAMGACVAIEDAVVLGEVLSASEDLTTPLQTFMTPRFELCRLVADNSLQLGEWEKDADAPGADPVGLTDATQSAIAVPSQSP